MGKLVSHIPALLEEKGWDTNTFVGHCMLAGMGPNTAYRLARGDTNVTAETLKVAARVLGVASISELVDLEGNEQ